MLLFLSGIFQKCKDENSLRGFVYEWISVSYILISSNRLESFNPQHRYA